MAGRPATDIIPVLKFNQFQDKLDQLMDLTLTEIDPAAWESMSDTERRKQKRNALDSIMLLKSMTATTANIVRIHAGLPTIDEGEAKKIICDSINKYEALAAAPREPK